jgi:predicted nucleic acid-binding Zn ribbon protein
MIPVQRFASGVLAELVRRQPPSKARTDFAWQLAVGPGIARATVVELKDGVLTVTATDARWLQELKRAREVVLGRLQDMMGPDQITRIKWNTRLRG